MPGGLLNLISEGSQNVFLTGNPTKTFFKAVYKKYSNFGLQRLRIDYSGQRFLNLEQDSVFRFKVPRYAELLMDTFLVINIPDIWSPIHDIRRKGYQDNLNQEPEPEPEPDSGVSQQYKGVPYEFQWINNLGLHMIKEITISAGGQILQKFPGSYLIALKERDFDVNRKKIHDRMTGNVAELNDPASIPDNAGNYPNAVNWGDTPAEPSIRGRKLYIPIDAWFSLTSKMAFPLISMQYNELQIQIRMRPIKELFTIKNVLDSANKYPRVQPNFNISEHGFYRFIQSPIDKINDETGQPIVDGEYEDKNVEWNTDIHLMATYAFLTDDESKQFAAHEQKYLIKEVHEYNFDNITGSKKLRLETSGMVASWMFYLQRNDIYQRNQWSNFSNWDYETKPYKIIKSHPSQQIDGEILFYPDPDVQNSSTVTINDTSELYVDSNFTKNLKSVNNCSCERFVEKLYNTGPLKIENQKEILLDLAILFDGQYREEDLDAGIFNYVDKYTRTSGNAKDGLYCYNFCLSTNPFDTQPSGAINMSKFEKIELEINTIEPPRDSNAQVTVICDDEGDPIGVRQPVWDIYKFNYDLTILEERYNILHFIGGNCALTFAR